MRRKISEAVREALTKVGQEGFLFEASYSNQPPHDLKPQGQAGLPKGKRTILAWAQAHTVRMRRTKAQKGISSCHSHTIK